MRVGAFSLTSDTFAQLDAKLEELQALIYPFTITGQLLPTNVILQAADIYGQTNSIAGGNAGQYLRGDVSESWLPAVCPANRIEG